MGLMNLSWPGVRRPQADPGPGDRANAWSRRGPSTAGRLVDTGTEDLRKVVLEETGGLGGRLRHCRRPFGGRPGGGPGLVRKRGTGLPVRLPAGGLQPPVRGQPHHPLRRIRVVGASDSTARQVEEAALAILAKPRLPEGESWSATSWACRDFALAFQMMLDRDGLPDRTAAPELRQRGSARESACRARWPLRLRLTVEATDSMATASTAAATATMAADPSGRCSP